MHKFRFNKRLRPRFGAFGVESLESRALLCGEYVELGPIVNEANGHAYYLLNPMTWTEAEDTARLLGGNLVTINDAAEDAWVRETFANESQVGLWTGLNDEESEGEFVWSSGQPVSYTNWSGGQPDDFQSREDHVMLYQDDGGRWADFENKATALGRTLQGVVEVEGVVNPANGHTYHLLSPSNWTDAEARAVELGGHLVTINDQAEQEWLFDTFAKGHQFGLWTGLSNRNRKGEFVWSSGQTSAYTNWGDGRPDRGQRSVMLSVELNGRWVDFFNREHEEYRRGRQLFGIVEYEGVRNWQTGETIEGAETIPAGICAQLSDWNTESRNLRYADFSGRALAGSDFSNSWLANAQFDNGNLEGSDLTEANLSEANITGTNLRGTTGFTAEQLYSTASYQQQELANVAFDGNDLSGWNLTGQILTGTSFVGAGLEGTDFTAASIGGAKFAEATSMGFTAEQLYSTNSYRQANLAGVDFQGTNLSGWDLESMNLRGANLDNTHLMRANLENARLDSASIRSAVFDDATVKGTDFSGSSQISSGQLYQTRSYRQGDLQRINLDGHDLVGWDLHGQNLAGAVFTVAQLWGADLSGTNLTNARLSGANVAETNFEGAIITGVQFASFGFSQQQLYSTASYANQELSGINFSLNDLRGWNFQNQNLENADFTNALLWDANLAEANLANADLGKASFVGANLSGTKLANANLRNASLVEVNLSNANLAGANLRNVSLTGANLTKADVAAVDFSNATGLSAAQLYSTATYENQELAGVRLSGNDLSGWDFRGQDLSQANLEGAQLSRANFSTADLTDARLSSAVLAKADFTGARISNADLSATTKGGLVAEQLYSTANYQDRDLTGVNLSGNDLAGWDFHEQDLTDVNLVSSSLEGTDFTDAVVDGMNFDGFTRRGFTADQLYSTSNYRNFDLSSIKLGGNDLSGWNFHHQDLSYADLRSASLEGANLAAANLSNALLKSANLREANLSGADLSDASFPEAVMREADLNGADLSDATFPSADLSQANLSGADLTGADGQGANFELADLSNATMNGAVFRRTSFAGTTLDGTDMSRAILTGAVDFSADDSTITRNMLWPDHEFRGLHVENGEVFSIRSDLVPWSCGLYEFRARVNQSVIVESDAVIEVRAGGFAGVPFCVSAWVPALTQLSFADETFVSLDGTLRVSNVGRLGRSSIYDDDFDGSYDLFEWPEGAEAVQGEFASVELPPGAWDISELYDTGVIKLTAVYRGDGDFNVDGELTAADVDHLSQSLRGGRDSAFDLTDDRVLDERDHEAWVTEVAGTRFGDANLDGVVRFSDFLDLATNFGSEGGWAKGDFNADEQIDFADFLLLAANFGKS